MHPLRVYITSLFATSVLLLAWVWLSRPPEVVPPAQQPAEVAVVEEPEPPAGPQWVDHEIQSGETIGTILAAYGVPLGPVEQAARGHHDLSRIRAGQTLSLLLDASEDLPLELRYALDADHTLVVVREGDVWTGRLDEVIYEHRQGLREIVVTSSLWQAAVDAGLRPADIASLARVYQYDIDFNTEIRAGARARMVVEELWQDGTFARLGTPLAVRLENSGKEYVAIRFEQADGSVAYYDEEGTARKKAFLRSPIEFSRVTSGFTMKRYHPILKKSRPHLGTDFGAPTGTPVRAIGDAVVVHAGRNGGHGNFVKLDHEGPYASSYSHLSKVAVHKGQKISQGMVVGYVGSTGLSTGPHLHFQFWVNGRTVNPMTVQLPRQVQVARAERQAFDEERDNLLAMLDGSRDARSAVAESGSLDTDDPGNDDPEKDAAE